jgi:hypothetical protein
MARPAPPSNRWLYWWFFFLFFLLGIVVGRRLGYMSDGEVEALRRDRVEIDRRNERLQRLIERNELEIDRLHESRSR